MLEFNRDKIIDGELPYIILNNIIALPDSEVRVELKDDESIKVLDALEKFDNYCVLVVRDSKGNLIKVGVVCKLMSSLISTAKTRIVRLKVVIRCTLNEYKVDDLPRVSFVTLPVEMGEFEERNEILEKIKLDVRKIPLPRNFKIDWEQPDIVCENLSTLIIMPFEERIKYLTNPSLIYRLNELHNDINKSSLYKELDNKIENDVRQSIDESQKEYYLREKIKAIQNELGDKIKSEDEIDLMRNKLKSKNIPEDIKQRFLDELARYSSIPTASPESSLAKTYLDFVISLPWNYYTKDSSNLKKAEEILNEDHYGLDKVKNRILEYLAVKMLNDKNPSNILCLVGPPGVGKTSIARSIARALDKEFVKLSLGGVHDESEIRGHRRTYVGALPGRILSSLSKCKSANPVFLLDEIDKMASDFKGDPTSAMLEVLDPEQNEFFQDHYLSEPFDLSQVFFIATANYLENIPEPLRDRMEIVEVPSYTVYEKEHIVRDYILPRSMKTHGVTKKLFSITDDAIRYLIEKYTIEAGVREAERVVNSLVRKVIKKSLIEKVKHVEINLDNIKEFLGKEKIHEDEANNIDLVGCVNGLAYTQAGGCITVVECSKYPGKGNLILTGKLGDVMKESAQLCLSYVKSVSEKYNIDKEVFEKYDIHIHFPEGAVPKDGPSAGVTITTAILSCLTNKKVLSNVAMTGEMTLRGRVMAIGGLREKSQAAYRNGIKTIYIPSDNLRDLDDVSDVVKENVTFIPVKMINEILDKVIMWEDK